MADASTSDQSAKTTPRNENRRSENRRSETGQIVFVTGMHRSGTSLVAKAVDALGFDLGSQLMPAAPENPKGFNEDKAVFEVNEQLLASAGLRWDLPSIRRLSLPHSGESGRLLRRANSILTRKLYESPKIALKDPRFCMLLPAWLRLAHASSAQANLLITVRHPLDVADSLYTRDGLSTDHALRLWRAHYYALVQAALQAELRPHLLSYPRLLADPRGELDRLMAWLELPQAPKTTKALRDFTRNYLDAGLCHSTVEQDADADDSALSSHDRTLYQLLATAATTEWSPNEAQAWLDRFPAEEEETANALLARKHLLDLLQVQIQKTQSAQRQLQEHDPVELELRKNQELIALERRKNLELLEREQSTSQELTVLERRKNQELLELEQSTSQELTVLERRKNQELLELEQSTSQELTVLERRKNQELLELEQRKNQEVLEQQARAKELEVRGQVAQERAQSDLADHQARLNAALQQLSALETRTQELEQARQEALDRAEALQQALATRQEQALVSGATLQALAAELQAQLADVANLIDRSASLDAPDADAVDAIASLNAVSMAQGADAGTDDLDARIRAFGALVASASAAQRKTIQALIRTARSARQSHREVERHLIGALTTIDDLRRSLSYRLGRAATFPARLAYDLLYLPASKFPFRAFFQLLGLIIRHPIYSLRQINRTRLKNAWITFFRKPASADAVVDFYQPKTGSDPAHRVHGSALPLPAPENTFGCKVSIFSINFNGEQHLAALLDSIAAQGFRDVEVILVDNGSNDGSVDLLRSRYPRVKTIALPDNRGFAEANNIAAEAATGRYWCLLNNDMVVDPNWLTELVQVLDAHPDAGAVGPKIRFWKPFVELRLESNSKAEVLLDIDALLDSLTDYPKVFFPQGWTEEREQQGRRVRGFSGQALLRVPFFDGQAQCALQLRATGTEETELRVHAGAGFLVGTWALSTGDWVSALIDPPQSVILAADHLINNAGSVVDAQGNVADRGFAEVDTGQYERTEEVSALCGGAMLLRPECLRGRPLFSGDMFAYFEDTDLSLRLRQDGYRLFYCGRATVYHKHASTSTENSAFFRFYVTRNRLLFNALHFPQQFGRLERTSRDDLRHLAQYYSESGTSEERRFADRIPELLRDWDDLLPRVANGTFYAREPYFPRIAVYNNFWNSLGGGEKHAAVIASVLQQFAPVDLISEQDFEIGALERCFGLDLKYCRKRLLSAEVLHHSNLTREYDLFINSTFASDLCSLARRSFYIVSFPYPLSDRQGDTRLFLAHYHGFWANSAYTQGWVKRWWNIDADVLYPVAALQPQTARTTPKEKLILHVGRFFLSGHNKKQLELVQAFRELHETGAISAGWRLILVGQVHTDQQGYVDAVADAARDLPVSLRHDVPYDELERLYDRAAIYWHATGLNEAQDDSPELFEHFGITTIEAMSHGCVPIVINAGGQPEIVHSDRLGYLFDDEDGLKAATAQCVTLYEDDPAAFEDMAANAARRAADFELPAFQGRLSALLEQAEALPSARAKLI